MGLFTVSFIISSILGVGTILTLLGVGTLLYFWNNIRKFFQKKVIPWIRTRLGDKPANILGMIIAFADDGAVFAREEIKAGWKWLHYNVLGVDTKYRKISGNSYEEINTVHVRMPDNTVVQHTVTEEKKMDADDLDPKIKARLEAGEEFTTDDFDILTDRYKKEAQKQGLTLEN